MDIIGIVDDGNVMTPSNPHSEFSGRVIYGDATPVINLDGTGFSHAALVAGIVAAKGNGGNLSSSEGIAGMNWKATIYSKDRGSDITAADAVRAAVDAGAQVINNSWGQDVDAFSITIARAFAYAYKSNRLSVVAMSQTSVPTDYPNDYDRYTGGILNVAAIPSIRRRKSSMSFQRQVWLPCIFST